MKKSISTVLAMAVGLLAVYTLAFRVRSVQWDAAAQAAADRLSAAATAAEKQRSRSRAASATAAVSQPAAAEEKKQETGQPAAEEPVVWGNDPFVRDWVLVNELASLSLRAITLGGEKPYVLINDQILEEGDQISGKRIVKIECDRVVLEQGGRTFNLMLGE